MFELSEMKIEVTYNCPLACVHCSSDANPKHQLSLSVDKCIEMISDATSIGLKEISFTGGEPLVWEGIIEAIRFSNKMGLKTSIYTSGNCNDFDSILVEISAIGIEKLIFSLFSDNENEHNRVTRKKNSFSNTLRSMKLAQTYGVCTEVHFVALASNYTKLTKVVEIAKANGANQVSVLRFVPHGRGRLISSTSTLNKEQNLELKGIILDLRNAGYDIRTGSPFNVLHLNENPKCMAAQDRLIIAPDLSIYPCDAFKQISSNIISPGDIYSNLSKHNIADCWKKSKYFELVRNAILTTPSEPCSSCNSYSACLSGCLAQKYLFYSSMNRNPDPACLKRSVI